METFALLDAVKRRDVPAVKLAVKAKTDLNVANERGVTALMLSVDLKNIQLLMLLLEGGAQVDAHDDQGQTALMLACGKNFLGAIKRLLAAKADPTLVSKARKTALDYALAGGHSEAAKLVRAAIR